MSLRVITAEPDDFRARVVVPLPQHPPALAPGFRRPVIDIVVPVHNEERDLASSVRRLHAFLAEEFPFSARITIADNASTDGTRAIAMRLAAELDDVRVLQLNEKGRGRALAAAWLTSDARVVAYMDVDLSTDLSAPAPAGRARHIGSQRDLDRQSPVDRRARHAGTEARAHLARLQPAPEAGPAHTLQGRAMRLQGDARRRRAQADPRGRQPQLVLRHRAAGARSTLRLRIHELPVDWTDDANSSVDIVATALEDLRGVLRLATGRFTAAPRRLTGQLVRFGPRL